MTGDGAPHHGAERVPRAEAERAPRAEAERVPGSARGGDADIARIAALIGDPTRARLLMALADGRALPASRLAAEAGVAPSTMSEHLGRLTAAGLLSARAERRARLYRLASPAVADVLEALARISPPQQIHLLRQDSRARALRLARTCYGHLAGRLGVALFGALLDRSLLTGGDGLHRQERAGQDRLSAPGRDLTYRVTPRGRETFARIGIDVAAVLSKRPPVRYCVDWSAQQHHLAGPLGTALTGRLFDLDWVRRSSQPRVVTVTGAGQENLTEVFGLPARWAEGE